MGPHSKPAHLAPDHGHRLEGEVLLLVVDEPGRALRDVVEAEGEENEEDAGDETQPVPGKGATHDVAADNSQGGHHLILKKYSVDLFFYLRKGATDVS